MTKLRVDYTPMWITVIERGMTLAELRNRTGLSPSTFTKLRRNGEVNVSTLLRCAEVLECGVERVVRFIEEGSP